MPALLIIAFVLAAVTALFAIQNATVVTVSFLGWEWEASLALILILTLGVGILVGYLAGLPSSMKKGRQLRQARKKVRDLEGARSEQPDSSSTRDLPPEAGEESLY